MKMVVSAFSRRKGSFKCPGCDVRLTDGRSYRFFVATLYADHPVSTEKSWPCSAWDGGRGGGGGAVIGE